ncbi:MAG: YmaF family protein [Tumebacillaceae bacterium]
MRKFKKINLKVKHAKLSTNAAAMQTHVHEFTGSTKLAEMGADRHNHRFAGVTGQVIPRGKSHIHRLRTNTDFLDHFHQVIILTGLAIPVGDGKHVHFVKGMTTRVDGHMHRFQFTTLIDSPLT